MKPVTAADARKTTSRSTQPPYTRNHGRVFETPWAKALIATYHPSASVRIDQGPSAQAYAELVADVKLAHSIATAGLSECSAPAGRDGIGGAS